MKDLVVTYTEAKFGKEAAAASMPTRAGLRRFVGNYFPEDNEQSERLRAIRDAIESSIREEQKLRGKSLKATEYAKHRATTVRAGGPAGLGWDVIRAAIPGLSPQAFEDDGIEKTAQPPPEPDSRWGPAVHLGAGVTGAGLGAAHALRGLTIAGQTAAIRKLISAAARQREIAPREVLERIATMAGRPSGRGMTLTVPHVEEAIRAVRGAPLLTRLHGLFRRFRGSFPATPAWSPAWVPGAAPIPRQRELGRRALTHLRGTKLPWKGRAAIGAVALTLPFILYNLWKNRALRAKGGPEATRAAEQAEHWLGRAENIRKWRGQQLSQMELAGAPGKYKLLPFAG